MNILVVKPSSMGDIVHTFPAVAIVREHYPDARIAWIANDNLVPLVKLFPPVDEAIAFDRKRLGKWRHCPKLLSFCTNLRKKKFDLAFDFQGLFRSGVISYISGAPKRVGFRDCREHAGIFYTDRVSIPPERKHAVEKNIDLVELTLGTRPPSPIPTLETCPGAAELTEKLMDENNLEGNALLAVAPASRWESKNWPPGFFGTVIDQAASRFPGLKCWILGTGQQRTVADSILSACSVCSPCNLAGKTNLTTMVEMLRRSDALLAVDTGPMHVAAFLGIPTVALFGPTDPALTGPFGTGNSVFIGECDVSPCLSNSCLLDNHICTVKVSAADVAKSILAKLKPPPPIQTGRNETNA